MRKSALILLILSLLLVAASACGKPAAPGTVTDDLGRQVSIEEIPQRIVSLAPSITEILFALDLGDKVVGVTDYCDYPDEAKIKPVVSSYYVGTDMEALYNQTPDLVLTDGFETDLLDQLDNLKLTAIVLRPGNIDGIFADIELVGKVTGAEGKAKELVDNLQARLDAVTEKTDQISENEKPLVFYEIDATDPNKPWTATPGSFIDALITLAGGKNIVQEGVSEGYVEISLEKILEANPDIIILGDYPYVSPDDVKQRPGAWQQLSAVNEEKVYAISDTSLVSKPGPRIIDGLEEMARIIHPELFE